MASMKKVGWVILREALILIGLYILDICLIFFVCSRLPPAHDQASALKIARMTESMFNYFILAYLVYLVIRLIVWAVRTLRKGITDTTNNKRIIAREGLILIGVIACWMLVVYIYYSMHPLPETAASTAYTAGIDAAVDKVWQERLSFSNAAWNYIRLGYIFYLLARLTVWAVKRVKK